MDQVHKIDNQLKFEAKLRKPWLELRSALRAVTENTSEKLRGFKTLVWQRPAHLLLGQTAE
jgi:hypothetical protein